MISHGIVDEGDSIIILPVRAWRGMGSPNLMSTDNQLLSFDRRNSQNLGILTQTPVTLGEKTILVDFMVIEDPLDFNMLPGSDYMYSMKVVVSMLFRVMYFPHNKSMVTVDQLEFFHVGDIYPPRTLNLVNLALLNHYPKFY